MSVLNIEELAFGSGSYGDQFSQTVTYAVTVEDGDGPNVIRRDPFFYRGKPYRFRSDSNPLLGLSSLSIRHDGSVRTRFYVDATFTSAEGQKRQEQTDGGQAAPAVPDRDSPESVVDKPVFGWEFRSAFFRRRADKAEFQGVYSQEVGTRTKWSPRLAGAWEVYIGPPLHSNYKPVEPTPEFDESGTLIRQVGIWSRDTIKRNLVLQSGLPGKVCSKPMALRSPDGKMAFPCAEYTLRLDQVYVGQHTGHEPWAVVEIEWTHKPSGWFEDIPDFGRVIKTEAVSGAGDVVREMHADEFKIRDARGEVLDEDSPLNGVGGINRSYDAMQFFNRWMLMPTVPAFGSFVPYGGAW